MKKYTSGEKQTALAQIKAGENRQQVADAFGIPRNTIDGWMRQEAKSTEVVVPAEPVVNRSGLYGIWLGRLRKGQQTLESRVVAANAMSVAAYVAFGKDLIEAKGAVVHGEWLPLLDELGIGHDTAEQFMNIATHDYIANSEHARNLPGHRTTLAELARLDPAQVEEAVDAGEVTPDSQRIDVQVVVNRRLDELAPEHEHERKPGRPRKPGGIGTIRRFRIISETTDEEILDFIEQFPAKEPELIAEIEKASDRIADITRAVGIGSSDE